jgi:hypothetical protein
MVPYRGGFMYEGFFAKGIASWIGNAIPRRSLAILPIGHLLLSVSALAFSYKAALIVFAISIISLLRYLVLAAFAVSIGHRKSLVAAMEVGLWFISFGALALVIIATARLAHDCLLWAAAAACLGPLLVTLFAFFAGARSVAGRHGTAGGVG